jgi:hypothetical protein
MDLNAVLRVAYSNKNVNFLIWQKLEKFSQVSSEGFSPII